MKTLKAGKTLPLIVSFAPENTTEKEITWKIDKPQFDSVDENNVFTGLRAGTTKVTAITSNGKQATFTLLVTK